MILIRIFQFPYSVNNYQRAYRLIGQGLALSALSLLLPFFASAQQFQLGPKGGVQVAYVKLDDDEQADNFVLQPILSYNAGGVLTFDLTNRIGLQTELTYSRKGRVTKASDTGLKNRSTYDHLEWSGMFRLNLEAENKELGKFNYHFLFGPNFSYWLGGKGTLSGGELEIFAPVDYKIVFDHTNSSIRELNFTNANRLQLGFDIGIGAEFIVFKEQRLLVDLRYVVTHSYLSPDIDASSIRLLTYEDYTRAANRVIALNVAYTFGIDLIQLRKGKSSYGKKVKIKAKPGKN